MTDQQIIDAIKAGGQLATSALDFVYDHHGEKVIGYLVSKELDKSSGRLQEEAHDLFVESIIALRENVLAGRLTEFSTAGMSTYLTTICRYKYYAQNRKVARERQLEPLVPTEDDEDEELPALLRRFVREMGPKCRELLTLFYFNGLPMKEVIKLTSHDYSSPATANVANQRCRNELRSKLELYLNSIN